MTDPRFLRPGRRPKRVKVLFEAQPGMQVEMMACPVDVKVVGGTRAAGKTLAALAGCFIQHAQLLGKDARGLVVRRKETHGKETFEEVRRLYEQVGAKTKGEEGVFVFPNGARLRFSFVETDEQAAAFAGHNYTWILVEEANQIANWSAVLKLLATMRGTKGGYREMIMTCNPEGPGMGWLKDRYIAPAPEGRVVHWRTERLPLPEGGEIESRLSWVFIPGWLRENKALLESDPGYLARLVESTRGNPQLYRAWIEGDWDAMTGQFFQNFGDWKKAGGVLHPFRVPRGWPRFAAADWGSARPFCVLWFAVVPEESRTERGVVLPADSLVAYREWYGVQRERNGMVLANEGLKLTADEVGRGVAERSVGDPPREYAVMDPSAWIQDGGPSIASRLMSAEREWCRRRGGSASTWWKADNRRTPEGGYLGGWDAVRALMGDGRSYEAGGRPMLYVFENCESLLRTMPTMVHDEKRPEDMKKTNQEDHAVDALRYGVMSRQGSRAADRLPRARSAGGGVTMGELKRDSGILAGR